MNSTGSAARAAGAAACLWLVCATPAFAGNDPKSTVAECLGANDAALELADANRLRAARAKLLVCARAECPGDVRKECARRIEELDGSLPTIVFDVKDASGRDVTEVRVAMDGEPLVERIDGAALAVDPGEHAFTFEAVGYPAVSKKLVVREGQKVRRESVVLASLPPPGTRPAEGSPASPAGRRADSTPALPSVAVPNSGNAGADAGDGRSARPNPWRVASVTALSLGAAGLGFGIAFGLDAISARNAAQRVCPSLCADQSGVDAWGRAKSAAAISTLGFVLGGVGAAAGVWLWVIGGGHRAEDVHARLGFGLDGVRFGGTW